MAIKIILVDDEGLFLNYLRDKVMWAEYGIFVEEAFQSGKLALEWLNDHKHKDTDGVFCDMKMPGINGIELIREVKRLNNEIYCVALSGYDDFPLVREAFLNGADDYIRKLDVNTPTMDAALLKFKDSLHKVQVNSMDTIPHSADGADAVENIRQYLEDNFAEDLQLSDLAIQFHFSMGYLSSIFTKRFGVSFSGYLTALRIQKARYYLSHTDLRITEICELVGYNNLEHFSRQFKRLVNCSPSQYRKINS